MRQTPSASQISACGDIVKLEHWLEGELKGDKGTLTDQLSVD